MTNIQQPEMRRSGHDPLVQDHREETAQKGAPSGQGPRGAVPAEQVSPYGRPPDQDADLDEYEERPRRKKR